jgi:cyclin B
VTNARAAHANANGKSTKGVVVAKRNNGVKTRSMSIGGKDCQEAVLHRAFYSKTTEDRNPAAIARQNPSYPRGEIEADPDSYQMTGNTDNIDERDQDDPLCITAYVEDMYEFFREKEVITSVRPVYMETQPHINERMRSILVDWLIEVHLKFKLVPETLYLTINLIDRYLQLKEVSRPKLQLVGVTSLLIASKYEEIYPPELRDLVYICDRAYTRSDVSLRIVTCISFPFNTSPTHKQLPLFSQPTQIIEMEENILKTLEYQITIPSAHAFLVRFLKAAHADKKIVQLSCYILDGTLQSFNLLHYLPSQLAAAAVFIARRSIGRNAWSPTLLKYAGYCEEEIIPIARAVLNEKAGASPELRAVNKKYSSHRYGGVANTALQCDF